MSDNQWAKDRLAEEVAWETRERAKRLEAGRQRIAAQPAAPPAPSGRSADDLTSRIAATIHDNDCCPEGGPSEAWPFGAHDDAADLAYCRTLYLSAAEAVVALLWADADTEWGVRTELAGDKGVIVMGRASALRLAADYPDKAVAVERSASHLFGPWTEVPQ